MKKDTLQVDEMPGAQALSPLDRVGLGWRSEIALDISRYLIEPGQVECLELIAEQYEGASSRQLDAMRELAAHIPTSLHGVSMGMGSVAPVPQARLDAMARLVDHIRPCGWSEHLSLVRAGGAEVGHLSAPPRCAATVAGVARNVARAAAVVGSKPLLENVATLFKPPLSEMRECEWLQAVTREADIQLLLDLHNLHANAINTGTDARLLLDRLPLDRVSQIHLSGGMYIPAPGGGQRLLDDHVHDVPAVVFELLEEVAARVPQSLIVIIERDGRYPEFSELVSQMGEARQALRRGRSRRISRGSAIDQCPGAEDLP